MADNHDTWVIVNTQTPETPFYVFKGSWTSDLEHALHLKTQAEADYSIRSMALRESKDLVCLHIRHIPMEGILSQIDHAVNEYDDGDKRAEQIIEELRALSPRMRSIARRDDDELVSYNQSRVSSAVLRETLGLPSTALLSWRDGQLEAKFKIRSMPLKEVPFDGKFTFLGNTRTKYGTSPDGYILCLTTNDKIVKMLCDQQVNYILPE